MTQASHLLDLGAKISGTNFHFHASGSYGAIFADKASGKVRKVFFRRGPSESDLVESVFRDEVHAYKIANSNILSAVHVPVFYGVVENCVVVDRAENPLSLMFNQDCAYEISFIEGSGIKLRDSANFGTMERIFRGVGIGYLNDASIFEGSDPPIIIDFGTFDPDPPAVNNLPDNLELWS